VLAAVLMLAIGTSDDVREVSAPAKVAGIVLCASIMVRFGVSMLFFRLPLRRGDRPLAGLVVPAQRAVGARHDERDQPDDGLDASAGVVAIASARSSSTPCSSPDQGCCSTAASHRSSR
jgi:UDP-GlcNAc:undecaprenyl-phosphate GlcNAc-1-phosphate transferase